MTTTAFRYRAARSDGRIVAGTLESATVADAGRRLAERGLVAIALDLAPEVRRGARSAPSRELAAVFQGLAALAGAGVPILRALEATAPVAGPRLRQGLARVAAALREGRSIGEGLATLEGMVPAVVIGIVRAGERTSRLAPALDEAAAHLELEADLEARFRQALAYPLVLLVAGGISTVIIATMVVPRFATIIADLGQQLPASTRLMLGASAFLTEWWWALLLGVAGAAALVAHVISDPRTREPAAEVLLGIPLLGEVRHALATARSARAAGAGLVAGVPLLAALRSAQEAAGDYGVERRLARAAAEVSEGGALAAALERHGALLASALQLVAVGEATGQLGAMFRRAGALAATEAERKLRTLVGLIEPGLVILFGGLVAFVAAALLQAVYSLRP